MFEAKDEQILGMDTTEIDQQFKKAIGSTNVKYLREEWESMRNTRTKGEKLRNVEDAEVGNFGRYVNSVFNSIHGFIGERGISEIQKIEESISEKLMDIFRISKKIRDQIPEELGDRALAMMRVFNVVVKLPSEQNMDKYKKKVLEQLQVFMETYAKTCDYVFSVSPDLIKSQVKSAWTGSPADVLSASCVIPKKATSQQLLSTPPSNLASSHRPVQRSPASHKDVSPVAPKSPTTTCVSPTQKPLASSISDKSRIITTGVGQSKTVSLTQKPLAHSISDKSVATPKSTRGTAPSYLPHHEAHAKQELYVQSKLLIGSRPTTRPRATETRASRPSTSKPTTAASAGKISRK